MDERDIAQLTSDGTTNAVVDETNVDALNAIERASATVETAALKGGRYTLESLAALQADDDWSLKGLVAELAAVMLYQRRGSLPPAWEQRNKRAMDTLEAIDKGKRIFRDSGAIAASKPSVFVINSGTRARLDLIADRPYYPDRRTESV